MGNLNIVETIKNFLQKIGLVEKVSEEEENSYYEMVYGLFYSRGVEKDYRCQVETDEVKNYIEFHLNKPCNRLALFTVSQCLDRFSLVYRFPEDKNKRAKLNRFKDSPNYKYSEIAARSIGKTTLPELQALAGTFQNETLKRYYTIAFALLSSVKSGVTANGIQKYIESKSGSACDTGVLGNVLELFKRVETSDRKKEFVYRLEETAKILYLNKHIFGNDMEKLGADYKCTENDGLHSCYPDIMKKIEAAYQNVIDVVKTNGAKFFAEGFNRMVEEYTDIISRYYIKKCIHNLTRKYYFDGNKIVEEILPAYLEAALWRRQEMAAVSSVALRALHYKNYKGTETEYSTFTEAVSRNFVLHNDAYIALAKENPYEKEKCIENSVSYIGYVDIFKKGKDSWGEDNFWMPDIKRDSYFADAVCYSFVKSIARNVEAAVPEEPNGVYALIWERITLTEEERKEREEEKRERERKHKEFEAEWEEKKRQKAEAAKQKAAEEKLKAEIEQRVREEVAKQAQEEENRKKGLNWF